MSVVVSQCLNYLGTPISLTVAALLLLESHELPQVLHPRCLRLNVAETVDESEQGEVHLESHVHHYSYQAHVLCPVSLQHTVDAGPCYQQITQRVQPQNQPLLGRENVVGYFQVFIQSVAEESTALRLEVECSDLDKHGCRLLVDPNQSHFRQLLLDSHELFAHSCVEALDENVNGEHD